jgi:hypothetical protein
MLVVLNRDQEMLVRASNDRQSGRRLGSCCTRAGAAALILLLAGTACSGNQPTTTTSPAASSAQSSQPSTGNANTQWAESVCSSAAGVRKSLDAIGTDLTVKPSAGAGARDQVKAQLTSQVASARASITELGAAIQAIPVDAEGAAALKESLTTSRDNVDQAVQAVSTGVDAATAATNAKDFLTATAQTLQAVQAAKTSTEAFLTTAKGTATTAGGDLKAAIDSAPSCAGPSSSPS